jgi:predicted enzyme related to lactoylglutathione lyase
MSRVQLALRVGDLEGSIDFYSKLFDTEPAKLRPGYANFAVDEPALKLVLLEGEPGQTTSASRSSPPTRSTRRPGG